MAKSLNFGKILMSCLIDENQKYLEEKIDKHHKSEWHGVAGIGGWVAMILPVVSEFEGIGENLVYAIGGTSAVSVFAMLLKIGRVTALASDIAVEHKEHLVEDKKEKIEERKAFNEQQLEKY